jgi:O-antigen ligase
MRYAAAEEYASAKAEFGLIWVVYLLGGAAVLALVAQPALVAAALLAMLFALVAYRLPELLLVFFVVVGPLKGTEAGSRASSALSGAGFPLDLTVLAAGGLLVAVGVSLWRRRGEPLSVPAAASFFLALVVLLLVGVLTSPDPKSGLDKALAFQAFSALAFLAPLAIVRTRRSMYRLLAVIVAVAVLVGFSAEEAERSESVLVLPGADNQIQVGLLLGLGVVSIVSYLWPASGGWLRLVWLAPAGFLLLKLVSAGGRSALVGTLLACMIAVVCLVRAGGRDRLAALALVGILAALLPAAWVTSSPAVKDRYLVTIEDVRGGAGLDSGGADRSAVADAAIDIFASHPLGAGTGAYAALTGYEWPHNLVLEVASELGLPGLAALAGLLVGIAVALVRAAKRGGCRLEVVGAASLLVLPLTVAFSSFDLNGNRTLWFACGLALAAAQLRR